MSEDAGTAMGLAERKLVDALKDLHLKAGAPSSRAMARGAGGVSHATVSEALRGSRVPSWPSLSKIVSYLGGDEEQFRELWIATEDTRPIVASAQVSVFVSYARIDDEATYGRVSDLVRDIGNAYRSLTGLDVKVFKDTTSITLGENWKDRIRLGLSSSLILLAFVSPAFLRSTACREELREFLGFLNASDRGRLILPLVFADFDRLKKQFASDDLWRELSDLECEKIHHLRTIDLGSSAWLRTVERLAGRIDEILSSFESNSDGTPAAEAPLASAATIRPEEGLFDLFEELEQRSPETLANLNRFGELIALLGSEAASASPQLRRADTFAKKLAVTTRFASAISPIADEMAEITVGLKSGVAVWDVGVRKAIEMVNAHAIDATESGAAAFLSSVHKMASSGIRALAQLESLHSSIGGAKGFSAKLDKSLNKVQVAVWQIAELRGVFKGWTEELSLLADSHPAVAGLLGELDP